MILSERLDKIDKILSVIDRNERIEIRNKIRNKTQRDEALQFFKDNDYS